MNNFYKTGAFICELRKAKGISQEELGSMLHVTKKAVSRWETGRGLPDSSILLPLSRALDVSVDEILKGEYIPAENLDDEAKNKIEKMNAVFEYLAEKKLLQKTLVAYVPITAATVLCAIRTYQLFDFACIQLESMSAQISNIPAVYIVFFLIFLLLSAELIYRSVKTLISRIKTR